MCKILLYRIFYYIEFHQVPVASVLWHWSSCFLHRTMFSTQRQTSCPAREHCKEIRCTRNSSLLSWICVLERAEWSHIIHHNPSFDSKKLRLISRSDMVRVLWAVPSWLDETDLCFNESSLVICPVKSHVMCFSFLLCKRVIVTTDSTVLYRWIRNLK